jgi:hypothetical protein
MKDALGHGSNGIGGSAIVARSGNSARGIMPSRPFREGGGQPVTSNAQAAEALMSTLKSTMVSIHPAMQDRFSGNNADYTTAENAPLRKTP